MQQNSKCWLCCDSDKTINHVISEQGVQDQAWLGGKGNPLVIMQEIKIWPY